MITQHYNFTLENNHWANYYVRKGNGEPFKPSLSSAVIPPEKTILVIVMIYIFSLTFSKLMFSTA